MGGFSRKRCSLRGKTRSPRNLSPRRCYQGNAYIRGNAYPRRALHDGGHNRREFRHDRRPLRGDLNAKGKVEIQTGAIVVAEIHTPCLSIEAGAVFDGRCHMLAVPQAKTETPKTITIPIRSAAAQAKYTLVPLNFRLSSVSAR